MKRPRAPSTTPAATQQPTKLASLSPTSPALRLAPASTRTPSMLCELPPHEPAAFASLAAYDEHYAREHVNRCLACAKNFPSAHYLGLHLAEHHDPLAAVRRSRGDKTYACLVEGCPKLCSSPASRRMHLVVKHGFPRDYDIYVISDGLGSKRSLLRSQNTAIPADEPAAPLQVVPQPANGDAIDSLSSSLAALRFVPRSVRAGRSSGGQELVEF